jgi:cyclopropane fatty-acyl-phospholipid synthase-like methyltransferase
MPNVKLPYFDQMLTLMDVQPDAIVASNMHWGLFGPDDPATMTAYMHAAVRLTERMCEIAGVRDGIRLLDVGCGFGGTIDWIDKHFTGCELVGLNIDRRQLLKARKQVAPSGNNAISWVEADGCALPFETGAFDVVLAVECIFHFPSRQRFFRDARRVVKNDGRMALSDLTINEGNMRDGFEFITTTDRAFRGYHGDLKVPPTARTYARLASRTGFRTIVDEDVTVATLPTYRVLVEMYENYGWMEALEEISLLQELAERRFLDYRLFAYEACEVRRRARR